MCFKVVSMQNGISEMITKASTYFWSLQIYIPDM